MDAKATHTPGPWMAIRNSSFWEVIGPDGLHGIGDVCASMHRDDVSDEGEANARLIAAAPDLKAFADAVTIFMLEDNEEFLWLRIAGQNICRVNASSNQGVALLKLEAERRCAIAKATETSYGQ